MMKHLFIAAICLALGACTSLYSQPSEIKKGDGAIYECNGEGSCYSVK